MENLPAVKQDGLAAFAAEGNGIDGEWFRCSGKTGQWNVDNESIEGLEVRIVPFLEGATAGEVKWGKNEKGDATIVERRVARIVDEVPPGPGKIAEGCNPYTAFFGVRVHEGGANTPLTFTSSSWGGRFAVARLMAQYVARGRSFLPVCALDAKARNDANGNWNPVFKVVTWVPAGRFDTGDEVLQIEAQLAEEVAEDVSIIVGGKTAKIIDDELPF